MVNTSTFSGYLYSLLEKVLLVNVCIAKELSEKKNFPRN
ncbi:hypothetical protein RB2501_12117 [Robiginitalea biformata HTCC2501]|uniref:Uncharacterized protein n=1 Tax=Robiginitalea biformata (strain ATCC BAA-864 / DSM 15991 / KCTC 12146 / HTCC2501) TaxID=313596 RepID=A4CN30_ROBBH|nr:hypothetical protein RB2501_12117 [Robiginitalea biformata HTCC2501]